jgi:glutamyl/glutaminyl-tRNA synthetase
MAITRFAPSPTGYLHIGGARTALFDLIWAKNTKGKYLLRIEDTDQSRNSPTAAKQVMDDLEWLGIVWDEGPDKEGAVGPYFQSQRLDIYRQYIQKLLDMGKAYYCFDTPEELEAMRKEASAKKLNFIYPRPKTFPTLADVEKAKSQGRDVVVRFCMPDDEVIVNDIVRGEVKFAGKDLSDFIILKSDGFPTYHLACVVDDELMGITHVIRGQEHLMNTPGHVAMQAAFGFKTPMYAHLSVIISEGGGKMSKREQAKVLKAAIKKAQGIEKEKLAEIGKISVDELNEFLSGDATPDTPSIDAMAAYLKVELPEINIIDFVKSGFLPETLVNFISLLGYSAPLDKEILTLQEIIDSFDPTRFNKTNCLFDRKKLLAFNTEHIKMLSEDALLNRYRDFLKVVNSPAANADDGKLKKVLKAAHGARTLAEIENKSRFLFIDDDKIEYNQQDVDKVLLKNGEGLAMLGLLKEKLTALDKITEEAIETLLRGIAEEKQIGLGKVAQPLRVAICGTTISLPIFESIDMLGIDRTLKRIENTLKKFK